MSTNLSIPEDLPLLEFAGALRPLVPSSPRGGTIAATR